MPEKLYLVSETLLKKIKRALKLVDSIGGNLVTRTADTITIGNPIQKSVVGIPPRRDFFLVKVNKVSGDDGDASNPPEYLYDVFALDGTTVLGEDIEVIGPRPNGETTAPANGSYAQACYDEEGELKLWSTLEKPTDDTCS